MKRETRTEWDRRHHCAHSDFKEVAWRYYCDYQEELARAEAAESDREAALAGMRDVECAIERERPLTGEPAAAVHALIRTLRDARAQVERLRIGDHEIRNALDAADLARERAEKAEAELATERERHQRVIDDYQAQLRIVAKERGERDSLKAEVERLRTTAIPDDLTYLPAEIRDQDNAITSDPVFIIEEREKVYGVSADYGGQTEVDEEGDVCSFASRWRFVTACFTRRAAQRYIEENRHNLDEPRVYVASAHRNREWIALRRWFLSLAALREGGAS